VDQQEPHVRFELIGEIRSARAADSLGVSVTVAGGS